MKDFLIYNIPLYHTVFLVFVYLLLYQAESRTEHRMSRLLKNHLNDSEESTLCLMEMVVVDKYGCLMAIKAGLISSIVFMASFLFIQETLFDYPLLCALLYLLGVIGAGCIYYRLLCALWKSEEVLTKMDDDSRNYRYVLIIYRCYKWSCFLLFTLLILLTLLMCYEIYRCF